jgi:hypothetical protein
MPRKATFEEAPVDIHVGELGDGEHSIPLPNGFKLSLTIKDRRIASMTGHDISGKQTDAVLLQEIRPRGGPVEDLKRVWVCIADEDGDIYCFCCAVLIVD